jgi:hypothetical protein
LSEYGIRTLLRAVRSSPRMVVPWRHVCNTLASASRDKYDMWTWKDRE